MSDEHLTPSVVKHAQLAELQFPDRPFVPSDRRPTQTISQLMAEIDALVSGKYRLHFLLRAEIGEVRENSKVMTYALIERRDGKTLTIKGKVWSRDVGAVTSDFVALHGKPPETGMKVTVSVRPEYNGVFGSTIELWIASFETTYELGDVERERQRIREVLKARGLWERNKRTPTPLDFFRVLVICGAGSKGLYDFKETADVLSQLSLVDFIYVQVSLQGPNMPPNVCAAFDKAAQIHSVSPLDAIALVRGGGDWSGIDELNNHAIAVKLAEAPVPVLLGVGHEDDCTILDQIAHSSFGTPSKTIGYIRQVVMDATANALAHLRRISEMLARMTSSREANLRHSTGGRISPVARARLNALHSKTADLRGDIRVALTHSLTHVESGAARSKTQVRNAAAGVIAESDKGISIQLGRLANRLARSLASLESENEKTQVRIYRCVETTLTRSDKTLSGVRTTIARLARAATSSHEEDFARSMERIRTAARSQIDSVAKQRLATPVIRASTSALVRVRAGLDKEKRRHDASATRRRTLVAGAVMAVAAVVMFIAAGHLAGLVAAVAAVAVVGYLEWIAKSRKRRRALELVTLESRAQRIASGFQDIQAAAIHSQY